MIGSVSWCMWRGGGVCDIWVGLGWLLRCVRPGAGDIWAFFAVFGLLSFTLFSSVVVGRSVGNNSLSRVHIKSISMCSSYDSSSNPTLTKYTDAFALTIP